MASECFNALGRKLQLNCAYSNDPSFISIDWNVTFLGRSTCEGETTCCPDDTVCTILVLDSEHFGGHHWLNLTACNGQTLCSVSVVRTDHGCSLTDYEYVTYRCITPGYVLLITCSVLNYVAFICYSIAMHFEMLHCEGTKCITRDCVGSRCSIAFSPLVFSPCPFKSSILYRLGILWNSLI